MKEQSRASGTVGTLILAQTLEPLDDVLLHRVGQRLELSFDRWGEEDGVGHREGLEAKVLEYCIE